MGESVADGHVVDRTSTIKNAPGDHILAQRYTAVAGEVRLARRLPLGDGAADARMDLYADNAGEAGALLATTELRSLSLPPEGAWQEFDLAIHVPVTAGTKYWVAVHVSASLGSASPTSVNDGQRHRDQSFGSGLPDPFGSTSDYSSARGLRMKIWTNPS